MKLYKGLYYISLYNNSTSSTRVIGEGTFLGIKYYKKVVFTGQFDYTEEVKDMLNDVCTYSIATDLCFSKVDESKVGTIDFAFEMIDEYGIMEFSKSVKTDDCATIGFNPDTNTYYAWKKYDIDTVVAFKVGDDYYPYGGGAKIASLGGARKSAQAYSKTVN